MQATWRDVNSPEAESPASGAAPNHMVTITN